MTRFLSFLLGLTLVLSVVWGASGLAADRQLPTGNDLAWTETAEPILLSLETPRQAATPMTQRPTVLPDGTVVAQFCCKHCTSGKPCGDSCIARNKTCHSGRGCACATVDIY